MQLHKTSNNKYIFSMQKCFVNQPLIVENRKKTIMLSGKVLNFASSKVYFKIIIYFLILYS